MNYSFLSAFYYVFFTELSASASNVQFHVPHKSGKLVSVTIQQYFSQYSSNNFAFALNSGIVL